jgi:predicted LPLAT superfamily acyltransferase
MPSWQGKSRGTHWGYKVFVYVLKIGGLRPAYGLLCLVTCYYFLFSRGASRVIFDYFHQRIEYGRWTSFFKIYTNFFLFGQTLIDKVAVFSGASPALSFEFDGEKHLHDMVGAQKGGLLLSAHIGNWEIAGHLLKRLGTRIHIVMFDGEQQRIKEVLKKAGAESSADIIVIKNDLSHIYRISDALKHNDLVCIHADRYLAGNKTLSARLLGKPARFPAGPFLLARKFHVPVSYVFAMKERATHYHFFASEPKNYDHWEPEAGLQQMVDEFAQEMEEKLRRYPAQWFNYYDFWKA